MPPPIAPGTLIGERYLVTGHLPDRGLGDNWAAQDTSMKGRAVALKLLRALAATEMPDELAKHLQALRPIRHRCLLAVINHGVWEQRPYLVHEHFPGRSLGTGLDEVRESGQLVELPVLQRSFDQVCEAVLACHQAPSPVLHLGLNPGCVLMNRQPKKDFEIKVLDVGLHRWADRDPSAPTRSARALESPAPELFDPATSPSVRTDVFALGALLRELISLPASAGETLAVAGLHRRRDDVPDEVWAVIERCVELDPARRFAEVATLRATLHEAWAKPLRRRPPAAPGTPRAPASEAAPEARSVFERLRALEAGSAAPAPGMTLLRASDPNPWDVAETPGDPFDDQPPAAPVTPPRASPFEALLAASAGTAARDDDAPTVQSAVPNVDPQKGDATILALGRSPFARPVARAPNPTSAVMLLGARAPQPGALSTLRALEHRPTHDDAPLDQTFVAPPPRGLVLTASAETPTREAPPGAPLPGTEPVAARPGWLWWAVGAVATISLMAVIFALAYQAGR